MNAKIKVLVADDHAIARAGIQSILELDRDIEVMGAVGTASEILPQVEMRLPELIVLDLKWHQDDHSVSEIILELRDKFPEIVIIGLTAYEELMDGARDAGATWVLNKSIDPSEFLSIIHNISHGKESNALGDALLSLKRIHNLEPGENFKIYEENVYSLLKYGLYPHLTNPRFQSTTISGSHRRDIMFSNYSSHMFWQRMVQRHDATLVVFETKNVKALKVHYVDQVAGYLTPWVGRLGFLVSNISADLRMVHRAIEIYKASSRVILFLCNHDLQELIALKSRGEEPTKYIQNYYDNFMALM